MLHPSSRAIEPNETEAVFSFAGWRFRPERWELVSPSGRSVSLVHGEMRLLRALVERPGRVLSRERLLELTHANPETVYDRAVDIQLCRLRRKLRSAEPGGDVLIRTLVGAGYMFVEPVTSEFGPALSER